MKNWRECIVTMRASLGEAIATIDKAGTQIALVVDAENRLAGVVTDGDCRRAILRGAQLNDPVSTVMSGTPITMPSGARQDDIRAFMLRSRIHQLPLLAPDGTLAGMVLIDDLLSPVARRNAVVLMAGGLGSRLGALTRELPKPMLAVSGKPILEIILENFVSQGFTEFFFSVNYLADTIREYFSDGSRWGANIRYLQEETRLGTAGSLSLLPADVSEPFIVMNGDLLTRLDFVRLLEHHVATQADATMVVREHETQVPFGVVRLEDQTIVDIVEKPVQRHFVNAGIYVLSGSNHLSSSPERPVSRHAEPAHDGHQGRPTCLGIPAAGLLAGYRPHRGIRARQEGMGLNAVESTASFLAIIPARRGSKGLPRKNVRSFRGEPLVDWTIRAALASRFVAAVVVTSDDDEVLAIASRHPGCLSLRRPPELATDTASSLDVVLHALQQHPEHRRGVLLQPTSPLRRAEDVDRALSAMIAAEAESCVSVTEVSERPEWMLRIRDDGTVAPLAELGGLSSRRQDLPDVYIPNGAIYGFSTDWLRRTGRFVDDGTIAYVMPAARSIDIDTELDFLSAEAASRYLDASAAGQPG